MTIPPRLKMWSYDLAREQSPSFETLRHLCQVSLDAGYKALGLYLEHNFQYRGVLESPASNSLTGSDVALLQAEFPDLMIVPMINVLGHMEGFLRTQGGEELSEERFAGLQACPLLPESRALAEMLIDSVIAAFASPLIHIGGDETAALGRCARCREWVKDAEETAGVDGKAQLYREFMNPLIQRVIDAGRTPAIWADMLLAHPQATEGLSKHTVLFDWQYQTGPLETSRSLCEAGYQVVLCPTLHAYNASWLHLPQSEANIRTHVEAEAELGALGVCVTTWEGGLFGNTETWIPAVEAAGRMLDLPSTSLLSGYEKRSPDSKRWAELMGVELNAAGGIFAFSGRRSSLKCRFLLYCNPFLLWLRHGDELCGEVGDAALGICEKALRFAGNAGERLSPEIVIAAITFTRAAEEARISYANGKFADAIHTLAATRQIFEYMEKHAVGANLRFGASRADEWRCRAAKDHVDKVILRLKRYGDGSLGYLPSFESLVHPLFTPYDQANWWLVNSWARE